MSLSYICSQASRLVLNDVQWHCGGIISEQLGHLVFASTGSSCGKGQYDHSRLSFRKHCYDLAFSTDNTAKGQQTNDKMIILSALSILLAWFPFFYWICNFGENLTTTFANLNDSIYAISWHLYPPKLQKYMQLIVLMAQKPVHAKGVAGMKCSRDTFKSVHIVGDLFAQFHSCGLIAN